MTQAQFEINEVKRIEREIEVDASQTDCMIYDQRGDWDNNVWISERAHDQLLNWLFDRVDRIDGQYCWTVLLNGRRGYLFCEYNREDGITGIRFACRYPRIRKAKPVIDPEWERYNRTEALRTQFEAIEQKCHELFRLGSPIHHNGHQDAWFLCASALDNAGDTAQEHGWYSNGLEYWKCALGSLQSLVCDASPRVRRWFKKIGLKF